MGYQSINPYSGEHGKQFAEHTEAEVSVAVARAQTCFAKWQQTTFAQRSAILSKAALILRTHKEKYARLIAESRGEVELSADIIEYYAQHAEEFLAPQILSTTRRGLHQSYHSAGSRTPATDVSSQVLAFRNSLTKADLCRPH